MAETEQNRSEKPTSFKLKKAREKGNVARGPDLGFLTVMAAFAGYAWIAGDGARARIALAAQRTLVSAATLEVGRDAMAAAVAEAFSAAARPLAFLCATVFLVVLVFEIAQTGFVVSTHPLKPDFSRLSPANGFKRVFSVRTLVEAAKSLLKLCVYAALAVWVVRSAARQEGPAIVDGAGLAGAMTRTGLRLLLFYVAAAAVFAAIDQGLARRHFLTQMRMSRRELKRESRDREGEPRMKQRRKQLHGEFVKMSQSLRNLRGADVLITNPTHVAVALRYDPATMVAPMVVSMGGHQFAQRLKGLAFVQGVPIMEDRRLARALHRSCQLNQIVPETHYGAVANLYLALRARAAAPQTVKPA